LEASSCHNWPFEANDTTGMGLAKQLKAILENFGFTSKVLCYVKNKVINLARLTIALKSVISCEALNLFQPFDGTCFGHAMNKVVQYATNDDKMSKDLALISVKFAQTSLYLCTTWPK
jgi:hypothetical protein